MNAPVIRWRLHLASPPEDVHALLATDEGGSRFWAESAVEQRRRRSRSASRTGRRTTVASSPASRRRSSRSSTSAPQPGSSSRSDGAGGTDLTLTHGDDHPDTRPGWVSVLMALKAAADFGVDLRNHDPARTWDQGFVDN